MNDLLKSRQEGRNWLRKRKISASIHGDPLPKKNPKKARETLSKKWNYRIAIREAAKRGTTCILLYHKVTGKREINRYEVIPTQYEYKLDAHGKIRKALWVQDCRDGMDRRQIKLFYCHRIIKGAVTDRRRTPKWKIRIY